ncbi:MAG: hypothetical protein ACFFD4_28400 [Candidatus Odinarchaeota archaeon]
MSGELANQARLMHTGLQKLFVLLKARDFSPNPLNEEREIEEAIHQVLQALPLVKVIEGYLDKSEKRLFSPVNDLIELTVRAAENEWSEGLLESIAENRDYQVFQKFELFTFDQLAIEVNPEIFLHLFRSGENIYQKMNDYLNYLQNVLNRSILCSVPSLFVNPTCSACGGKGTIISGSKDETKGRITCTTCNGKGKLPQIRKKVNLFYLTGNELKNGSHLGQTTVTNLEPTSAIKEYWKHYAATKLRILANSLLAANFLGNQTRSYFESCNSENIIEQYKISSQKLDPARGSYWLGFEEFREHNRVVHLRKRYKEAKKSANRNPRDKLARKREKRRNKAINDYYRGNLEIFAGPDLKTTQDYFVGKSLEIARSGKFTASSWKKLFQIYHPELITKIKEFNDYFSGK